MATTSFRFVHYPTRFTVGSNLGLGDASPVLAVGPAEWSAFTTVVKAGHLDS